MSTEANKDVVRRYQEAHNTNNLNALEAIVASDLITHSQMPGLPPGLEGGKMVHQMTIVAMPDFRADIEDLIAEGDKVVARLTFRGTHTGGNSMGIPPSGRSFAFTATSIFRIANGKIIEHWGEEDGLGWLQQLGDAEEQKAKLLSNLVKPMYTAEYLQDIYPAMVTSGLTLPGYQVIASYGIVRGLTVRSASIGGQIAAAWKSLGGGNIHTMIEVCERARTEAFLITPQHAAQLGANAIIGFSYDTTEIAQGMTEVLTYGTAVTAEPLEKKS